MKILVMSDSHGRRDLVRKCIEKHSDVGIVLHLGDNVFDIENMDDIFPDKRIVYVRGNCDETRKGPLTACVEADGVRIFLTHGHAHAVKYGLNVLMSEARKNDLVMYLAHDLKTPLTSIAASTDIIELENGESEWTENIHAQITCHTIVSR